MLLSRRVASTIITTVWAMCPSSQPAMITTASQGSTVKGT
jgi:hypothetical protein